MYQHVENVSSLPGLYAFFGIDYTSPFFEKWKVKLMQIAIKKENFSYAFSN